MLRGQPPGGHVGVLRGQGFNCHQGIMQRGGWNRGRRGSIARGSCREGVRGETGGEGPGGHTEGREQNGESHRSRYMYIFVEITK